MPRLEELQVWCEARKLGATSYRLTLDDRIKYHFALIDQIRRSAISVPSNVAAGYGLGTRPQFVKSARIALGSAYELQTQLYLVGDLELLPLTDLDPAIDQCRTSLRLPTALLKSLGGQLGSG